MVDLAIAKFHAENVAHMTTIEQRIIGIDGNGTGREGALQRLDKKMTKGFDQVEASIRTYCTSTDSTVGELRKSIAGVTASNFRMENIPKKRIWHLVMAVVGAFGVTAMSFFGVWLEHKLGWK